MKSLYKAILLLIINCQIINCFAQQLAVGAFYGYDFIDKTYADKASGFSTGANLCVDIKKGVSVQTGFTYSLAKYNSEYDYAPYIGFVAPPPWLIPYNSTKIYKSFSLPLDVSYKVVNKNFYNIYFLTGISFEFRLNEYIYGTGYKILDTNLNVDTGPFDYEYSVSAFWDEDKFKFRGINMEFATGGDITLSDHIKSGIEFKRSVIISSDYSNPKDHFSLALTAKYYFDEIKKPKK